MGDVKPHNVLIDETNLAWVIDFGGGCSPPFVTRELMHTKEGDIRGLSETEKYLKLEITQ
jgi:hypothetical protein